MNTLQNTLTSEQNLAKTTTAQQTHDAFGQKVAARLTAGQADIHHDISERLRVARQMAVAKCKRVAMSKTAGAVYGGGGSATMSFGRRFNCHCRHPNHATSPIRSRIRRRHFD